MGLLLSHCLESIIFVHLPLQLFVVFVTLAFVLSLRLYLVLLLYLLLMRLLIQPGFVFFSLSLLWFEVGEHGHIGVEHFLPLKQVHVAICQDSLLAVCDSLDVLLVLVVKIQKVKLDLIQHYQANYQDLGEHVPNQVSDMFVVVDS